MSGFKKVPNIGNVTADKLNEIGVCCIEDLQAAGSRETFLRLSVIDPST